mmetsp:Transcript_8827/g.22500  ORF Transcript_8827/g.22500 Transcript_8827/m.22500 type:complete len:304 (+) Transcript_8827:1684-2595(+)
MELLPLRSRYSIVAFVISSATKRAVTSPSPSCERHSVRSSGADAAAVQSAAAPTSVNPHPAREREESAGASVSPAANSFAPVKPSPFAPAARCGAFRVSNATRASVRACPSSQLTNTPSEGVTPRAASLSAFSASAAFKFAEEEEVAMAAIAGAPAEPADPEAEPKAAPEVRVAEAAAVAGAGAPEECGSSSRMNSEASSKRRCSRFSPSSSSSPSPGQRLFGMSIRLCGVKTGGGAASAAQGGREEPPLFKPHSERTRGARTSMAAASVAAAATSKELPCRPKPSTASKGQLTATPSSAAQT